MFEPKATAPHLDSTIATSVTDGGSVSAYRKLKESTPRLAPGRPQPPTVGFDNRAADREAHAHAVGLRRVEGVENVLESLRRQSRTRISHPYEHAARVSLPAADEQLSRPVAGAAHCLDGIHDQIEDHLLQLYPVALNERQAVREVCLH